MASPRYLSSNVNSDIIKPSEFITPDTFLFLSPSLSPQQKPPEATGEGEREREETQKGEEPIEKKVSLLRGKGKGEAKKGERGRTTGPTILILATGDTRGRRKKGNLPTTIVLPSSPLSEQQRLSR